MRTGFSVIFPLSLTLLGLIYPLTVQLAEPPSTANDIAKPGGSNASLNPVQVFFEGLSLFEEGRYREAQARFEKARELQPGWDLPYLELARIYLMDGKTQSQAITAARQAIEIKPANPRGHFLLGLIADDAGDGSLALKHYRESLQLRPKFPQARRRLAALLSRSGQPGEAIEHYIRLLKDNPEDAHLRLALAHTYENLGDLLAAEAHLLEVLRRQPDNLHHLRRLERFYLTHEMEERLRPIRKKIETLDPSPSEKTPSPPVTDPSSEITTAWA